jgi:hypothetical protein
METGDLEQAIRDGAIRVYDGETGELKARWEFKAGWAARLMVTGRGEELVIVHDGFIRDQPYAPGTRQFDEREHRTLKLRPDEIRSQSQSAMYPDAPTQSPLTISQ